jgi:hypothetical protein
MTDTLTPVQRLSRDIASASVHLTDDEARFLVDQYYAMQRNRIRAASQANAMAKDGEPHSVLAWLRDQSDTLETQIQRALDRYSASHPVGEWLRAQVGIGPVIAAGLLAHIDISKAPTVGHVWRFAGLDPTVKWGKGQKRPWNAALKVICWKAGESFVKQKSREGCYYGEVYEKRKALETERNERGDYAEQARISLETRNFGKDTDARRHYEAGRLPPARIHLRAQRYAVKLMLSHLHDRMWRNAHGGEAPPLPYPIAHMEHAHYVAPPEIKKS